LDVLEFDMQLVNLLCHALSSGHELPPTDADSFATDVCDAVLIVRLSIKQSKSPADFGGGGQLQGHEESAATRGGGLRFSLVDTSRIPESNLAESN
jgi:hypothetical protein